MIIFQTSKHKTVIHAVNRKTCLFLCTCFFTAGPKLSFLFLRNKVPWKDNGQWSSHKLSPLTNWQYLRSILGLYVKVYEYNFLALNVKPPAEKLLLIVRPHLKNTLPLRGRLWSINSFQFTDSQLCITWSSRTLCFTVYLEYKVSQPFYKQN